MLKKDQPSPLAPESDEEKAKEAEKSDKDKKPGADKDKDKDKEKAKEEKPVTVEIDLDDISQRILALPIPARNYYGLFAGKAGRPLPCRRPQVDPIEYDDGGPAMHGAQV